LILWTLPIQGNYLTPKNLLIWIVIFLICGVGFVPVALSDFIKIKRVWLVGLIPKKLNTLPHNDFRQRYAQGKSVDHHSSDRFLASADCLVTNQHQRKAIVFDFRHFAGWHIH
jgi:hypothetical protein